MKKLLALLSLVALAAVAVLPVMADECSGVCGDFNNDACVNDYDFYLLFAYIWQGGAPPPCPDQVDVNGDCSIDVGDLVYLCNYLWKDGPAPHCDCGA